MKKYILIFIIGIGVFAVVSYFTSKFFSTQASSSTAQNTSAGPQLPVFTTKKDSQSPVVADNTQNDPWSTPVGWSGNGSTSQPSAQGVSSDIVSIYHQDDEELLADFQPAQDAMNIVGSLSEAPTEAKMHPALQNLLTASQKLESKITTLRNTVQQQVDSSTTPADKQLGLEYLQVFDLKAQVNKKISELATFALGVNWDKPTQAQLNQLVQFGNEMGGIEKQIETICSTTLSCYQAQ